MTLQVEQFPCRDDNYGVLVHDPVSGRTALIDAPEEEAIVAAVERTGWTPDIILTTHWHPDHVEANLPLKARYGLTITGPQGEATKVPGIDRTVTDGDEFAFGSETVRVIATPGHTAGHIVYHFPQSGLLFAGDTLFSLGCGRLFEAPAAEMQASLARIAALPPETRIYCGHEYTASNARFALSVDPDNAALAARSAEVGALRAEGKPTLPTTLGLELATNPFLRWGDPAIRRNIGLENATDAEVLGEVRRLKDVFK
jgi:hydroxyacylglutathione hydrolase